MINVNIKKLSNTATVPTYGSDNAACCDLYADILSMGYLKRELGTEVEVPVDKVYIGPGDTLKIPTGLSIQPPEGYCALIYARSGLSTKKGLRPANCVGVCDEDYRGNYIVAIHNDSDETRVVEHGDRIAQLMFVKYNQANFNVVDELDETNRGCGGFGSTG